LQKHKCDFCGKKFSKEQTLIVHSCIYKQRHYDKDKPAVLQAFSIYKKAIDPTGNKKITYEKFTHNKLYTSFLKFSNWLRENKLYNINDYIDWLLKNNIIISNWNKESVYQQYIYQSLQNETVERSIERFVLLAEDWAKENQCKWQDIFDQANTNWICHKIQMGQISPWIYLGSNKGQIMLQRLTSEQLSIVINLIEKLGSKLNNKIKKEDKQWINNLFM